MWLAWAGLAPDSGIGPMVSRVAACSWRHGQGIEGACACLGWARRPGARAEATRPHRAPPPHPPTHPPPSRPRAARHPIQQPLPVRVNACCWLAARRGSALLLRLRRAGDPAETIGLAGAAQGTLRGAVCTPLLAPPCNCPGQQVLAPPAAAAAAAPGMRGGGAAHRPAPTGGSASARKLASPQYCWLGPPGTLHPLRPPPSFTIASLLTTWGFWEAPPSGLPARLAGAGAMAPTRSPRPRLGRFAAGRACLMLAVLALPAAHGGFGRAGRAVWGMRHLHLPPSCGPARWLSSQPLWGART